MQRSAIAAAPQRLICGVRLFERAIFGESDHATENGVVLLQPGEVHLGQLQRTDAPAPHKLGELGHR